jgi:cytochrome P450
VSPVGSQADALAGIDFTDLDNFAHGFPHDLFAVHRREAPVYWHEPTDNTPDGEGFWSVATYAETLEVLKDPATYSSVTGGGRPYGGTLLQDLAIAGQVLNMMDDPRHTQIRRLVSSGLTPRMIRRVEDDLRSRARRLLDDVVPGEPFDFLVDIAAELPMQMICILLGVPEAERHWLFEAIEPQFDFGGSRKATLSQLSPRTSVEEAGSRMYAYGQELIAAKRANPTDDMLSVVANARLDDAGDDAAPALSDLELYLFFSLLFSAGAETTRNAVAGGLLALAEHPLQLRALRDDVGKLPTAVEEMVRWTSPSPSKRRTATRDVTLGGQSIEAGQKVQIWEGSANRDPGVFENADRFDIGRKPNPHLGFGQGVHYCLGANLARLELRVLYEELLSRFAGVRVVQPVEWTRSNRHTGIRHLVVELDEDEDE